jgi:hypothetical protein
MIPKEKADELITKFMEINNIVYRIIKRRVLINVAKKNSILAVDEILSIPYLLKKEKYFYNQVKKELEKHEF